MSLSHLVTLLVVRLSVGVSPLIIVFLKLLVMFFSSKEAPSNNNQMLQH